MFDNRLVIESPGGFLPFVDPESIYGTHHPRNPKLMHAMFFLSYVKMASEGTRRMKESMEQANLPEPTFAQKEIDYSRVRVTLQNDINKRREWVDTDAVAVVGAVLAKTLSENEKRIINFVAENNEINVTQAVRLTKMAWGTAKKTLELLVKKEILIHIHRDDIERDPNAKYVLP